MLYLDIWDPLHHARIRNNLDMKCDLFLFVFVEKEVTSSIHLFIHSLVHRVCVLVKRHQRHSFSLTSSIHSNSWSCSSLLIFREHCW